MPAGAIFAVDTAVGKLIECLTAGELPHDQLVDDLTASGLTIEDAEELIAEMVSLQRDRGPRLRCPRRRRLFPRFSPSRRW